MALDNVSAVALLAGFPEPSLVIVTDGTVIHANAAAGRLLGAAPADVEGQSILRFLPEEERGRLNPLVWLQRWAEQPEAPELRHVYLMCRDLEGGETPVRVRVGRIETTPPAYVVMLHDISEEQARQQQSRQAHRLAARVLAISADAIINVDEDVVIRYANPSAERLFGYPSGELVGRPLADLLPARFRADHSEHVHRFADSPQAARLMAERSTVVGLTAMGEEIPLEASITKVTLDRSLIFSACLRDLRTRRPSDIPPAAQGAGRGAGA
jgi:PAS domain S-box-containing protein